MMNEKTRISMTHYDEHYTVEVNADEPIDNIIMKLRGLLVLCGYGKDDIFRMMRTDEEIDGVCRSVFPVTMTWNDQEFEGVATFEKPLSELED